MEEVILGDIHERMDRLPLSASIWRIVVIAAIGSFLDSYEIFFTGYIAPKMVQAKLFTPDSLGVIAKLKMLSVSGAGTFVFATFAGFWVGGVLVTRIADKFGRKPVFIGAILWYGIASFILAFQNSGFTLDIWRFIACIGIGAQLITLYGYLSEMVPPQQRGLVYAVFQAIAYTAVPIMAVISLVLVPADWWGLAGWRWVILIAVAVGVVNFFLLQKLPESPRWLATHGRRPEAEAIVHRLEVESGVPAPAAHAAAASAPARIHEDGRFKTSMFKDIYLVRTIMLSVFNAAQSIGFYGFGSFIPAMLMARGVHFLNSLEYGFIIALGYPIGAALAATVADRFERKWMIVFCACVLLVSMTVFAQLSNPFGLVLFGLCFTLAGAAMASIFPTYESELYPTSIRVTAVGFVWSWSRVTAALSGLIIGYFLEVGGSVAAAVFIGCAMVVVILCITFLGPLTRARSLEKLSPEIALTTGSEVVRLAELS